MKLISGLFLVVGLICSTLHAEPPAKAPAVDRNALTFLNWDLELRIDTQAESLSVRGKIKLRNDSQATQRRAPLQISSSLNWASIRQNGAAIPFVASKVRSDLDHSAFVQEAIATLASPLPPGAMAELEVGYSGTVSLDTTRLAQLGMPLEVRAATDYDRITPTFTCLRGVGHVLWFPVSIEPAIMGEGNRLFEEISAWAVRHSSSSMMVSFLDASSSLDPGFFSNAQARGASSDGIIHDPFFAWNHLGISGPVLFGGNYKPLTEGDYAHSPLGIWFFLDHQLQAEDYARVIRDTAPTISGKEKFPAAFVDLPEAEDAAFEDDSFFLTPLKTIDRKSLELTIAFMLAHQSLWSPRAWIYEGAAHLAQVLMRERQDGRGAAIAYMEHRLSPFTLADTGSSDTVRSNSLINTTSEVFYRTKAMYVWWMLREIVGERALLDSLEQYDPAADKETSYMQKLLEKNSHKDLEWFFDDWVYQDKGLPELSVSNGFGRPSLQGLFLVSATVENKGGPAVEVPVTVRTQTGDVTTRLRVPGHGKNAVRVEVSGRPIEVTINDGSIPEIDRSNHTTAVKIENE